MLSCHQSSGFPLLRKEPQGHLVKCALSPHPNPPPVGEGEQSQNTYAG
jgi:hypothetical protein